MNRAWTGHGQEHRQVDRTEAWTGWAWRGNGQDRRQEP